MRTAKILFILGIMLFVSGCVPSLHPLFTEKDLIFEPALVGTWGEEGREETWTFQKSGDNTYDLFMTDKMTLSPYEETSEEIVSKFDAYLVKLDKFLFLDIFPKEPEVKGVIYKFHLIPVHTFRRVWIEGDMLRIAILDYDWLKKMINDKKISIAHERLDKRLAERLGGGSNSIILLTASTKELQEFVLKYAEDVKAFKPGELHRQKD